MTWDPVWERVFRERDRGRYPPPPEEVVRFVARNFYRAPNRRDVRILEIGCGPGSGTSWFVAREGFSLYGIDASPTAIEKARRRFAEEGLEGSFVLGAVDKLPWENAFFDAVIDNVCLACNNEAESAAIAGEIFRVLKPGGVHFSLTPAAGCWGDSTGTRIDATTVLQVGEGPFAGLGKTRFATRASLLAMYHDFHDIEIDRIVRSMNNGSKDVTHWQLACRK